MIKINLGSGDHKLDGWLNVDIAARERPDLIADLAQPLPFVDGCADYIHTEDFFAALTLEQAHAFLRECRRVLKPQGAMRLLTPDLEKFARMYLERPQWLVEVWKRSIDIPLRTGSACEVFNIGMRLGGQFHYDHSTLIDAAAACGLRAYAVAYAQSAHAALRNIDLRRPEETVSMYLECVRAD
ncbi:MAG TPA: methyltransferase domain-containing protein [Rudaea sp.]|jgi:predicted SAM-dependent methyltransferase|nr:methyltransferase domain-containing protein [Rudaea sp.]